MEDACAVKWLNRLCAFLQDDGFDNLVRECSLVPDQLGCLKKLSDLYRDVDVDNALKDIADEFLGLEIRATLRDRRLTAVAEEVGRGDRENGDVTRAIIDSLQRLSETGSAH